MNYMWHNEFREFYKIESKLIKFCGKCQEIFLYGAGEYGSICLNILQKNGIKISGFITTDGNNKKYYGLPIYKAEDKLSGITKKTGIILSVKETFQTEILLKIKNYKLIDVFIMENKDFYKLGIKGLFDKAQYLKKEFPVKKITYPIRWKKILVVRLDAIGDLIWTTAFLRELKRNFSESKITLVIRRQNYCLVECCPYVDRIILYDCPLHAGGFSVEMDNRAKLFADTYFSEDYDVVFLPRPIPRSYQDAIENILLAIYSRAKIRIARADFIQAEECFLYEIFKDLFSVVKKNKEPIHEVARILELLKCCGGDIYNDKMELWLKSEDIVFADNVLERGRTKENIVYIAVGTVSNDKNRTWDFNNYEELIRRFFIEYGNKVIFVLLGGNNAEKFLVNMMDSKYSIINLVGKTTLSQAAAVINECDIYIGANTGLLHMAAAFEKPILEISAHLPDGADTDGIAPVRTGAWKVRSKVIQPVQGLDDCTGFCRKTYAHCINQISADGVIVVLSDMIKNL